MFSGLISRWHILCSWSFLTPSMSCRAINLSSYDRERRYFFVDDGNLIKRGVAKHLHHQIAFSLWVRDIQRIVFDDVRTFNILDEVKTPFQVVNLFIFVFQFFYSIKLQFFLVKIFLNNSVTPFTNLLALLILLEEFFMILETPYLL